MNGTVDPAHEILTDVVDPKLLEIDVEAGGPGAELAFPPHRQGGLSETHEGAPEGMRLVELEFLIFKMRAADKAAEDGRLGKEAPLATPGAGPRRGLAGVLQVVACIGEERGQGIARANVPELHQQEIKDGAAHDRAGLVDGEFADPAEVGVKGAGVFGPDEVLDDE